MHHWRPLVLLIVLCGTVTALAQTPLVITRTNFAWLAGNDTLSFANVTTPSPTEGQAQVWDYSTLTPAGMGVNFFETKSNPAFPDASFFATQLFDTFAMSRGLFYEEAQAVTDAGFVALGISIADQPYSIGDLTGNPLDSLNFDARDGVYATPRSIIPFPMTHGTTSTSSFIREASFRLTLGLYGITNMPGLKRQHYTQVDSVVGWGTLTMPTAGGGPVSFPALLMKRMVTVVDSLFLGGQPAPDALLQAFGLSQGRVWPIGRHILWRAGARNYAMMWSYSDHQFASPVAVYYDKAIEGMTTGMDNPPAAGLSPAVFPNPTTGRFTIDAPATTATIVVRDILGRRVLQAPSHGGTTITLPSHCPPGLYLVDLLDAHGLLTHTSRIALR